MRRSLLPVLGFACMAAAAGPALAQPGGASAQTTQTTAPANGGIAWASLTPGQQEALQPLAALWPAMRTAHQRKWIALARNFHRMSEDEQATLQARMAGWASLTDAERTQARLNFGEVRRVPADEKRAKWEEYRALPAEERKRLASKRPKPTVSAAPALRPATAERAVLPLPTSVAVPASDSQPPPSAYQQSSVLVPLNTLKSAMVPIDRNTLLPLPAASAPKAAQ